MLIVSLASSYVFPLYISSDFNVNLRLDCSKARLVIFSVSASFETIGGIPTPLNPFVL
jgi:hypothetical protein